MISLIRHPSVSNQYNWITGYDISFVFLRLENDVDIQKKTKAGCFVSWIKRRFVN